MAYAHILAGRRRVGIVVVVVEGIAAEAEGKAGKPIEVPATTVPPAVPVAAAALAELRAAAYTRTAITAYARAGAAAHARATASTTAESRTTATATATDAGAATTTAARAYTSASASATASAAATISSLSHRRRGRHEDDGGCCDAS